MAHKFNKHESEHMFLKSPLQRWPVLYQDRTAHAPHPHILVMENGTFPK